jgi:hypothetical protein
MILRNHGMRHAAVVARKGLQLACLGLAIMAGHATAFAQGLEPDQQNDTPAIFSDNDPSLKNSRTFPPALTTAGVADPGSALSQGPMTPTMLFGQGPGCTALSPCAAISPPPVRSSPVHADARHAKVKSGA